MASHPPALVPGDLAGVELFRGLSAAARAEIAGLARVQAVPRESTLFRQGAPAERCHVLLGGRVRITQTDADGAQLLVRFVGPGEIFGTVALFTDRHYPADAVSVLDSLEASWPEPVIRALMVRHPGIALNLVTILGERLREIQERLRETGTRRVERRVAQSLLRLARRAGAAEDAASTIPFPLTRKDVAEMCGTTLYTVSRILTAWEAAELITTERQRVTLRDPAALRRLAAEPPG